tara:strand:+ start:1068 stop:2450 length:1383 start_codon:yes stop_codon:yes gene_type:complete
MPSLVKTTQSTATTAPTGTVSKKQASKKQASTVTKVKALTEQQLEQEIKKYFMDEFSTAVSNKVEEQIKNKIKEKEVKLIKQNMEQATNDNLKAIYKYVSDNFKELEEKQGFSDSLMEKINIIKQDGNINKQDGGGLFERLAKILGLTGTIWVLHHTLLLPGEDAFQENLSELVQYGKDVLGDDGTGAWDEGLRKCVADKNPDRRVTVELLGGGKNKDEGENEYLWPAEYESSLTKLSSSGYTGVDTGCVILTTKLVISKIINNQIDELIDKSILDANPWLGQQGLEFSQETENVIPFLKETQNFIFKVFNLVIEIHGLVSGSNQNIVSRTTGSLSRNIEIKISELRSTFMAFQTQVDKTNLGIARATMMIGLFKYLSYFLGGLIVKELWQFIREYREGNRALVLYREDMGGGNKKRKTKKKRRRKPKASKRKSKASKRKSKTSKKRKSKVSKKRKYKRK